MAALALHSGTPRSTAEHLAHALLQVVHLAGGIGGPRGRFEAPGRHNGNRQKRDAYHHGDYLFIVVLGPAQVKADGSPGSIRRGDLLTASASEGRVMKAEPVAVGDTTFYAPGTLIGKAMEPLRDGGDASLIWVWVTLQ